ncbi:phosphatase [Apophysomyces ossiformis]|uniref:protein-tyrosine-phosphatase n=1 Tax=Apophysomyces ossiformis TaxID=679940 RepID=A0A8H7C073_9FUNG|nr:phosphatase [Apophysomyces ossiformis]
MGFLPESTVIECTDGAPVENPTEQTQQEELYKTLECGADGIPGGILITSVGQEVFPGIYIGGYTALESRKFLQKNKITHILTMGHFKQHYTSEDFIIPISDNPEANIIQHFDETYEFIDPALAAGHRLLVHCLAGVSRSPTVVAAYLMKKRRLRVKEALALIKQSRPFINPNPGFIKQLRLYQEMEYSFDPQHPAYIEFHKSHPLNADHVGHSEYQSNP